MNASEYLVAFAAERGSLDWYGYQGTMVTRFVDAIERDSRARNHVCLNEQGASLAACGGSQVSGLVGLAYATSGPGAVNLLQGVANAYMDSIPVLFVTGQLNASEYTEVDNLRQQGFQEIDIVSMAAPVTKWSVRVGSASELPNVLDRAWRTMLSGRPGPVLIDLPMDVQSQIIPGAALSEIALWQMGHAPLVPASMVAREIARLLSASKRPVILVGTGCSDAGLEAIAQVSEQYSIPVVATLPACSRLRSRDGVLHLGHIGTYGHRAANMAVFRFADLVLSFGSSLCPRQTGLCERPFAEGTHLVRIDADSVQLSRTVSEREIDLLADAASVACELPHEMRDIADGAYSGWNGFCSRMKELFDLWDSEQNSKPSREGNTVVAELSRTFLKGIPTVAVDVGQHMLWVSQSFEVGEGQRLLFSGGHGAMGYSLPAAIGASVASGQPAAIIAGDGAFQMNIQELQWVVRDALPIAIVVLDNHSLGLIRQAQQGLCGGRSTGADGAGGYDAPDFSAVASAYGIPQERVSWEDVIAGRVPVVTSLPFMLVVDLPEGTSALPKTALGEAVWHQVPALPAEIDSKIAELFAEVK